MPMRLALIDVHCLAAVCTAAALSMLAGCAMPAQAPAPATPVPPQQVPQSLTRTNANPGSGKTPLDYSAIVAMVLKGAGDEDKELGRDILFPAMTAPDRRTGYIDINRKRGIFAECKAGAKLAKGNMVGTLSGSQAFADDPPTVVLRFSNCRRAGSSARK